MNSSMALPSSATLLKLAPRSAFLDMIPSPISIWFSQLAEVGVKWRCRWDEPRAGYRIFVRAVVVQDHVQLLVGWASATSHEETGVSERGWQRVGVLGKSSAGLRLMGSLQPSLHGQLRVLRANGAFESYWSRN